MKKSKILLIYTGGTIGMELDENGESLIPLPFEKMIAYIPELSKLDCELSHHAFANPVDSSDADPEFWNDIMVVIEDEYENMDGFVVLHGTDTMAYTASALSLMTENLNKPIVVTGSQLPMGTLRTDGRENLISSIEIASLTDSDGNSILQEVAIYFEYSLYRGNRCHKFSSEHFDAIISPNYPPLAEAGVHIHWNESALRKSNSLGALKVHRNWRCNISVIKFFPGIQAKQIEYQLAEPSSEVFIIETFGSGNIPMKYEILDLIEQKISEGKKIINVSQCRKGPVDQETYASGMKLSKLGVISARDMTIESALVKSMHLLAKNLDNQAFKDEFLTNYAGELAV